MGALERLAQTLQIFMGVASALGLVLALVFAPPREPLGERIAIWTAVAVGIGALVGLAVWAGSEL